MNPVEFEQQLHHTGRQYESLSPIPAPGVLLRFTGPFEQKTIIWEAHITTLAYYANQHYDVENTHPRPVIRPFIEVGEPAGEYRSLRVGLNVAIIDEATIRKTIIMIRQYRLLRQGRYDYGEPYHSGTVG